MDRMRAGLDALRDSAALPPGSPLLTPREACNLLWAWMRLRPDPRGGSGGGGGEGGASGRSSKRRSGPERYIAESASGSPLPFLVSELLTGLRQDDRGRQGQVVTSEDYGDGDEEPDSFSPMVGSPLSPHDLATTFWAVGVAAAVRPEAAAAAFADGRALRSSLEGGKGAGVKESLADSSPSEEGSDASGPSSPSRPGDLPFGQRQVSVFDLVPELASLLSDIPPSAFPPGDLAAVHRADLLLRGARMRAAAAARGGTGARRMTRAGTGGRKGTFTAGGESSPQDLPGLMSEEGEGRRDSSDSGRSGDLDLDLDEASGSNRAGAMDAPLPSAFHGCPPSSARPSGDVHSSGRVHVATGSSFGSSDQESDDAQQALAQFGVLEMVDGRAVVDVSHFSSHTLYPDPLGNETVGRSGSSSETSGSVQRAVQRGAYEVDEKLWWEDASLSVLPVPLAEAVAAAAREEMSEVATGGGGGGGGRGGGGAGSPYGSAWRHEVLAVRP